MKNEQKQQKISGFLALLLFGVFAVCILMVLLMGAGSYQRMTERDQKTYAERTAVQYLTTRVRQADASGGVSVEKLEGLDALVLSETLEDEVYETKLYCYEGWLMECYAAADSDLSPVDGERILEAQEMNLSMDGQMLQIELTLSDGTEEELTLQLRSGREVLP
ncbi:MAG: DUF4860 domain-containing protein [Bacillota bacterium]|nr:DUF4860 domain-containing protein [Bacillota bacterium]